MSDEIKNSLIISNKTWNWKVVFDENCKMTIDGIDIPEASRKFWEYLEDNNPWKEKLKAEREKNAEQQELIEKLKDCLFEHFICPECISSEYSLEAEGTMYCQVCEYKESSEDE